MLFSPPIINSVVWYTGVLRWLWQSIAALTTKYTESSIVGDAPGGGLMINWMYYPKSKQADETSKKIVDAFNGKASEIDSCTHDYVSDDVLRIVRPTLEEVGFIVETGKKKPEKIHVPVIFGLNGKAELSYEVDAYHFENHYAIEVEAGRGVVNYQFLKDFFEACVMSDTKYLCIAIRNVYRKSNDFDRVCKFFDAFFASGRMDIPLSGLLIVGY
jgi:hypothetical protein